MSIGRETPWVGLNRAAGAGGSAATRLGAAAGAGGSAATALGPVADALDELWRLSPGLPLLALRWMHVNHPIQPIHEEWAEQDGDTNLFVSPLALIRRLCEGLLYAGLVTFRCIRLRWILRKPLADLKRQPFDLVAKTWRLGTDRLPTGAAGASGGAATRLGAAAGASGGAATAIGPEDFYYGDLQGRLTQRSKRLLFLYGDAWGHNKYCVPSYASAEEGSWALPELCLAPLWAPWRMVGQQIWTSLRLLRSGLEGKDALVRRMIRRAALDCISYQAIPYGLYYWIARSAVRQWHPKAFLTLYEGRGWEPIAWWGAKQADPSCATAGYQHTILLRHNLALLRRRDFGQAPARPDLVLCLGERTRAMLASSHPNSERLAFGTFRRAVGNGTAPSRPSPGRRTVLVLPEGYPDEVKLLFDFAIRAAERLPDHRFILRCHPILPFDRVRRRLARDPQGLANVEVSDRPAIGEDFSRSSAVLYRGSSTVLYAVLQGLKPIYLQPEGSREADPLFELDRWLPLEEAPLRGTSLDRNFEEAAPRPSGQWRERVGSLEELEGRLREYGLQEAEQAARIWAEAAEYVEGYAVPVGEASLSRFLSELGLTACHSRASGNPRSGRGQHLTGR